MSLTGGIFLKQSFIYAPGELMLKNKLITEDQRIMAEYVVNIDGVADLSEEIENIKFESKIPVTSNARSSQLEIILTIEGRISFDIENLLMRDNTKKILDWSLVKPSLADSYKKVTLEYTHAGAPRKYELSHAFILSYTETFDETDGKFVLVLKQKEDMVKEVVIS
jgi:hypothetical protein